MTLLDESSASRCLNHRRLGLTLQKVILRNLIKPNQPDNIRSYLQNFNFAWCVGIFSW